MAAALTSSTNKPVEGLLFNSASAPALHHLERRILAQAPTFLSSLNPVFAESAQTAYLLHELVNGFRAGEGHKTFFANSHMEGLHGAIKLARHAAHTLHDRPASKLVFWDEDTHYEPYFDPFGAGPAAALIPEVYFTADAARVPALLAEQAAATLVVAPAPAYPPDPGACQRLLAAGRAQGCVSILHLGRLPLAALPALLPLLAQADIVVWGESLTRYQFPFGAFTTRDAVYQPWNSLKNCLLHSTTYGGNGLVTGFVRDVLLEEFAGFREHPTALHTLATAQTSAARKVALARRYINGFTSIIYSASSLELDLQKAAGSYLYARNRRGQVLRKLDCVGGSGCSMRGHNRADIVSGVLHQHEPGTDYFARLQAKLRALTGLDEAFPGVSGASAVEMGMILALLANPGKKKILVFNGNYAGKTLFSINGTDGDNTVFEPLYAEVEVINPYAMTARGELLKVLKSGEVALVWLEYIQGGGLLKIPPELISMLARYQRECGYWIGIDEILNGIYRTGTFRSFDQEMIRPDINTFAKGMSDMVFPNSVAIVSDALYRAAQAANPALVAFFKRHYLHQLGAHIALHSLEQAEQEGIPDNVRTQSDYIQKRINKVARQTKLFRPVEAAGLHIRINLNMKAFPFKYYSYEKASRIVTSVFYRRGNLVTFFGRMLPPLNLSPAEAQELAAGMEKTFRSSPWLFLWVGVKQYVHTRYLTTVGRLRHLVTSRS